MNICLDIDGVIADIAGGINRKLDKLGVENYDYAHWLIGLSDDNLYPTVFSDYNFWRNLKPFTDAWYAVNGWWERGYDVHLITARSSPESMNTAFSWLEDWRFQYSSLHFVEMGKKVETVKDLNGDVFVEDNPYELKIVQDAGVRCFLRRAWYNSPHWESFDSISSLLEVDLGE